jgi:peroxiredoxin
MRKTSGGGAFSLLPLLVLTILFLEACKGSSLTSPSDGGGLISLSGLITLSGQPFAGVDIYLCWGTTKKSTTGADGKFSFSDLPKGEYVITPCMLGYSFSPSSYELGSSSRSDLNFSAQTATTGTEIDSIATNFTARDQNGDSVSLYDYHGKVVLVDFTADWCADCRAKAETAEEFYQKFKNKGFMSILIVIDGSASTWANTYKLTFPVLEDNSQVIYSLYRKTSIPLPHVLDRNATIRYKKEGWIKAEVENMISKYQ